MKSLFSQIITNHRKIQPGDLSVLFNSKTGKWRPPNFSPIIKARLKKQAQIFDVNIPGITDLPSTPPIRFISSEPKCSIRERKKEFKQKSVQSSLQKMPQWIESWKNDKKKEKEKTQPKYPF